MLNAVQPHPNAAHVATQLVRQAHRTIQAWTAADEARQEYAADILEDRLAALEDEVSWHPAGSPEAALFQVCVAACRVDVICDCEFEDPSVELAKIARLLGSVIRYLEKTSGVRREDFGLDHYHDDRLDRRHWGLKVAS